MFKKLNDLLDDWAYRKIAPLPDRMYDFFDYGELTKIRLLYDCEPILIFYDKFGNQRRKALCCIGTGEKYGHRTLQEVFEDALGDMIKNKDFEGC